MKDIGTQLHASKERRQKSPQKDRESPPAVLIKQANKCRQAFPGAIVKVTHQIPRLQGQGRFIYICSCCCWVYTCIIRM